MTFLSTPNDRTEFGEIDGTAGKVTRSAADKGFPPKAVIKTERSLEAGRVLHAQWILPCMGSEDC